MKERVISEKVSKYLYGGYTVLVREALIEK